MATRIRPKEYEAPATGSKLDDAWMKFFASCFLTPGDFYIQHRKFHLNDLWVIPWDVWRDGANLDPKAFMYKGPTKMKQLERNYLNVEEIETANKKFVARIKSGGSKSAQSCITARMGAAKKRSDSQGFCMLSISLSYAGHQVKAGPKPGYNFDIVVNYRTTELCQKFYADLMFLHQVVFPMLLKGVPFPPTSVRFQFTQAYVSGLLSMPFMGMNNFADLMDLLLERDPTYWKTIGAMLEKWLTPGKVYSYRSHRLVYQYFRDRILPSVSKSDLKRLVVHATEAMS